MPKFLVACVDLFGTEPESEECDVVTAKTAKEAAEKIARSVFEDYDKLDHVEAIAVSPAKGAPVWEVYDVALTVHASAAIRQAKAAA